MFSVVMEKTIYELQGISCLSLEEFQPRKQIMSSRSFGQSVADIAQLQEAVAFHVTKAAAKLRSQSSNASGVYLFLHTNPFNLNKKQYANAISLRFPQHTHDTAFMIRCAMSCLKKIYRSGFEYHKVGIMLLDLVPDIFHQQDLFLQDKQAHNIKQSKVINTIDKINKKMGQGTVKFCTEGFNHVWTLRANYRSPRYTTCAKEMHKVYCR